MKYVLKLFIIGETPNSVRAIRNLEKISQLFYKDQCYIKVIDILQNPILISEMGIIAVPTLVKSHPPPCRKVIGDLSDIERVIYGLGLKDVIEKIENPHKEKD